MSPHDIAVWHTVHIVELIDAGALSTRPQIPVVFTPQLSAEERMLAGGEFRLLEHEPAPGVAQGLFASDYPASHASVPAQWTELDRGGIWVSTHGFYLRSPHGFVTWDLGSIDGAELVAPRMLWISGRSTEGNVSWILESDWAELVLCLWSLARHSAHPQFQTGTWVPPGWRQRIAAAGQAPPPLLSERSRFRAFG